MPNRVRVFDNKRLRGTNARMPQVQAAIDNLTLRIGLDAEALFASHDHPGGHRIEIDRVPPESDPRGSVVDGLISLVGPAALSVEFGHFAGSEGHADDRRFVKGLHILGKAAGL